MLWKEKQAGFSKPACHVSFDALCSDAFQAVEQFDRFGVGGAGSIGGNDFAFAVQQDETGNAVNHEEVHEFVVATVVELYAAQFYILDHLFPCGFVLVAGDADEMDVPAFVFMLQFLEVGQFAEAGTAPGCQQSM